MKIKLLRGCVAGGEAKSVGDIVDLKQSRALELVRMGKAELVEVVKPEPELVKPKRTRKPKKDIEE